MLLLVLNVSTACSLAEEGKSVLTTQCYCTELDNLLRSQLSSRRAVQVNEMTHVPVQGLRMHGVKAWKQKKKAGRDRQWVFPTPHRAHLQPS